MRSLVSRGAASGWNEAHGRSLSGATTTGAVAHMRGLRGRQILVLACAAQAASAQAHSFGKTFVLPLPVWIYAAAAAVSLVLSFLMIGMFVKVSDAQRYDRAIAVKVGWLQALCGRMRIRNIGQGLSLFMLLVCIATGFFGRNQAYLNFNMTFFWVIFALGLTYLTALVGNVFSVLNPWKILSELVGLAVPGFGAGKVRWRDSWGCYPAFILYSAFIWIELFGRTDPRSLSTILLGYTALNLVASWLFGARAWFRFGEFFSVYFELVGRISPFRLARDPDNRLVLYVGQPCRRLLEAPASHRSEVLFILFMLSSTAFDGFKDTVLWIGLYWKHFYVFVTTLLSLDMIQTYSAFQRAYAVVQSVAVPGSAYFYLGFYVPLFAATRAFARTDRSTNELVLAFVQTLVPIAVVYNAAHYLASFLSEGPKIVNLISDPMGFGWNLFGTKHWAYSTLTDGWLTMDLIWMFQVWVIILGHVMSVYLAHVVALRVFDRADVARSQVPILLLMVTLTTLGLWILSLPLSA